MLSSAVFCTAYASKLMQFPARFYFH